MPTRYPTVHNLGFGHQHGNATTHPRTSIRYGTPVEGVYPAEPSMGAGYERGTLDRDTGPYQDRSVPHPDPIPVSPGGGGASCNLLQAE